MQFHFRPPKDAILTVRALEIAADRFRQDAKNAANNTTYPPPLRKSLEQQFLQQEAAARRIAEEIDDQD